MSRSLKIKSEMVDRLADESWTSSHPVYRVTFWTLPLEAAKAEDDFRIAFNAEHWRVTEARDAFEVLAWARERGDMFELFVESEDLGEFTGTVLRLTGFNPCLPPPDNPRDYLSTTAETEHVLHMLALSDGRRTPPASAT